ncbi:NusA-like transcription termination signal-binding factor [Candidatus Woesearchaeota archaeon]|nr:NusA-like transcription termination signal-binding factor [Candidatus Woesearchaeota archaeon]
MAKITINTETMKLMSLFESVTGAGPKDCYEDDMGTQVFVVKENEIGRAVGRQGANVHRLERMLNRKIKIVEFNPEIPQFIQNLVFPLRIADIRQDGGVFTLTAADSRTRGLLIGRAAQNLRNYEKAVKRYFPIDELRVT